MRKTRATIPESLKIGPHIYGVSVHDDLRMTDGAPCWGQYFSASQEFCFDRDGTTRPIQWAETLLHENIHAISKHFHLELDEQKTRVLGVSLLQLLLDNDEVLNALIAARDHAKGDTK
jgi:hypothetical protein